MTTQSRARRALSELRSDPVPALKRYPGAARELRRRRLISRRTFQFGGEELPYFVHVHNRTWTNERCIEVPIARSFISRHPGRLLEVGNVLSHYGSVDHDIVDKFEQAPGVINEDVVDFSPGESYECIVSISTIEHVGFDEEDLDVRKPDLSIGHLRELLTHTGRLLVTVPMGHNPFLDGRIAYGGYEPVAEGFMRRRGLRWEEIPRDQAVMGYRYDPERYAERTIWIAEFPSC
jgi:hypothetical protein